MMTPKQSKPAGGFSFVEIMVAILILVVAVIGASGYRYFATLDARRGDTQITAARLACLLLDGWKAAGGYSGYATFDPASADDWDPNAWEPNDPTTWQGDWLPDDPNYMYLKFNSRLVVYDNSPGPAVPAGFSALDQIANPNYRIVVDSVNYYATLSYKDEVGEPRVLNVCVAWMKDYDTWRDLEPYKSVNVTTYAND